MKMKKIITATLLSGGLILGTTSAAYAVAPASSANLTVASYSSQFATYNVSSVAFDAATATFRTQVSAYAIALSAYRASDASLQQVYQAVLKANTPTKTAVQYSTLLTAYKTVTIAYNNSASLFMSQSNAYQIAVQSYEKSYQAAVRSYKATLGMYEQLNKIIYMTFGTAVQNANHAFAVALRASKTKAQKANAIKVRHLAVVAAIARRSAARVELGYRPISPIQQIKIDQKVDTFKTLRPVRPVKVI